MLVLSCKTGESILIDPLELGITITVLSNIRGKVRLGIIAPVRIPVYRQEVWERMNEGMSDVPNSSKE